MQPIDQLALMVRLEEVDLQAELAAEAREVGVDLVERLSSVDLGLARPKQVEVRSLEDQHPGHEAAPAGVPARRSVSTSRTRGSGTSVRVSTPDAVGSTQRSPAA